MEIKNISPSDSQLGLDETQWESEAIVMGMSAQLPRIIDDERQRRREEWQTQQAEALRQSVQVPGTNLSTVDI